MPKPPITVYQFKGRNHVRYIKHTALRIWKEKYNSRDDRALWRQAIKDAMTLHRNYLNTGIKQRVAKVNSLTMPKGEGCYWRDPKSGIWMPLEFN